MFTSRLCLSTLKSNQASQALKSCYSIFRFQKKFGYFIPKDAFKLFDFIVQPILCFAKDIRGYEYSHEIEKVQIDFCKRINYYYLPKDS